MGVSGGGKSTATDVDSKGGSTASKRVACDDDGDGEVVVESPNVGVTPPPQLATNDATTAIEIRIVSLGFCDVEKNKEKQKNE